MMGQAFLILLIIQIALIYTENYHWAIIMGLTIIVIPIQVGLFLNPRVVLFLIPALIAEIAVIIILNQLHKDKKATPASST